MKGIYKITDKISNKVYIGQSSNLANRFNAHISDFENGKGLKKHNPELQIENLIFEIIEICENEEVLDERERYWIKYYDSFFNGFNRTMGGKKWGEEEKQLAKEDKHPLYKRTAFYYPEIPQSYLRRWLSLDECRTLAKELNVRKRNPYDNESGTERMTWNTLKEKLSEFGYHYERKRYKKKQIVYFIDGEYIPMIRSA